MTLTQVAITGLATIFLTSSAMAAKNCYCEETAPVIKKTVQKPKHKVKKQKVYKAETTHHQRKARKVTLRGCTGGGSTSVTITRSVSWTGNPCHSGKANATDVYKMDSWGNGWYQFSSQKTSCMTGWATAKAEVTDDKISLKSASVSCNPNGYLSPSRVYQ